jgi:hypothetical protein
MPLHHHDEVMAARDLKRGRDILIRRGTPGAVKSAYWLALYTVEFRPNDDVDTRVKVRGLRSHDLTPIDAPPIMPTQPDRRGE